MTTCALIDAIIFVVLAIYAAFWTKYKLKMPLFKPLSIEKVVAMENPLYFEVRKRESLRVKESKRNSVPIMEPETPVHGRRTEIKTAGP